MKKLFLGSIVTVLLAVFLCGCNAGADLQKRVDALEESNSRLEERVDELERENDLLWDMMSEMGLKDGEFYTLQQAYDLKLITQEDLKSIAYYHNGGVEGNEEIMGENYQPQPKTPEVIDKMTERSIKQTFYNKYVNDKHDSITLKDIGVSYYWTCNNCIAVKIWCNGWGYGTMCGEEIVDGVKIIYNCVNEIKIWREK